MFTFTNIILCTTLVPSRLTSPNLGLLITGLLVLLASVIVFATVVFPATRRLVAQGMCSWVQHCVILYVYVFGEKTGLRVGRRRVKRGMNGHACRGICTLLQTSPIHQTIPNICPNWRGKVTCWEIRGYCLIVTPLSGHKCIYNTTLTDVIRKTPILQ